MARGKTGREEVREKEEARKGKQENVLPSAHSSETSNDPGDQSQTPEAQLRSLALGQDPSNLSYHPTVSQHVLTGTYC